MRSACIESAALGELTRRLASANRAAMPTGDALVERLTKAIEQGN